MTLRCRSTSRACTALLFLQPTRSLRVWAAQRATFGLLTCTISLGSCVTGNDSAEEQILHGTIAHPFIDESKPIGREPADERFVIKSATGNTEYTIEIPGAAREYDIMIPLSALEANGGDEQPGEVGTHLKPKNLPNPAATDREIVSALPKVENRLPADTAMMDGAFGVGAKDGPNQSPSYTLGIAKIGNYYKARKYEYALIELNNMLSFYPNSPQLHKMKGTVLLKLQNFPLAEKAWVRALDLNPDDAILRRGLERLRQRMMANKPPASAPAAPATASPESAPELAPTDDALAH